jgi:hypothetical protein
MSARGTGEDRYFSGLLFGFGRARWSLSDLWAGVFPAARERARRQYDAVEPENRLVARSLERPCAEQIEQEYTSWRRERAVSISDCARQEILAVGEDPPRLWNATATASADRKQIARLVIREVTLDQKRRPGYVQLDQRVVAGGEAATRSADSAQHGVRLGVGQAGRLAVAHRAHRPHVAGNVNGEHAGRMRPPAESAQCAARRADATASELRSFTRAATNRAAQLAGRWPGAEHRLPAAGNAVRAVLIGDSSERDQAYSSPRPGARVIWQRHLGLPRCIRSVGCRALFVGQLPM